MESNARVTHKVITSTQSHSHLFHFFSVTFLLIHFEGTSVFPTISGFSSVDKGGLDRKMEKARA